MLSIIIHKFKLNPNFSHIAKIMLVMQTTKGFFVTTFFKEKFLNFLALKTESQ